MHSARRGPGGPHAQGLHSAPRPANLRKPGRAPAPSRWTVSRAAGRPGHVGPRRSVRPSGDLLRARHGRGRCGAPAGAGGCGRPRPGSFVRPCGGLRGDACACSVSRRRQSRSILPVPGPTAANGRSRLQPRWPRGPWRRPPCPPRRRWRLLIPYPGPVAPVTTARPWVTGARAAPGRARSACCRARLQRSTHPGERHGGSAAHGSGPLAATTMATATVASVIPRSKPRVPGMRGS